MRLGVFGAGMIVHDFLTMFDQVEGLQLAYICATPGEEEVLKGLCETYRIPKYYTNVHEAFTDDSADTCYIGVPNHLHFAFVEEALRSGKHVICEKPFTVNYEEAQKLKELAEEKDLFLLEAVSTHYLPNYLKIRELLPTLGELKLVEMNFSNLSSRYPRFQQGEILPAFDVNKAGGALMDINIYNLNFVAGLFGEPEQIHYYPNIERQIDTSGVLVLEYPGFKCVLVGAKDCSSPINANVQGVTRYINIDSPVNLLTGFRVKDVVRYGNNEVTDEYFNYNDPDKHRMYYEFTEFVRILKENDKEKAKEMLELSLLVSKLQTKARLEAGIVFPQDKG